MNAADTLKKIAIFSELPEAQRTELLQNMRVRRVARGAVLVRQGAPSDALFIVAFGQFEVFAEGSLDPVAEIGTGQTIGEIGFFAGVPRTATVVAARDSAVLELDKAAFDQAALRQPKIYGAILQAMARRLGEMTGKGPSQRRVSPVRTIAIVAGGPGPLSPAFVERFTRACAARGRIRVVGAADARAAGGTGLDEFDAAAWLAGFESDCDLVVCFADTSLTPWTQCALRNASQLVIVVDGPGPARLSAVETFAFVLFPPKRRRLVRLHPHRRGVCDPSAWMRDREAFMTHHVALTDDEDVRRLRRFLTGEAIGFVAGGGGAFGSAHIGIYRAFREHGFRFDMFGGTSIGSGLTAGFAEMQEPEAIDAALEELFVRSRAFKRPTIPRYALLDHTTFDGVLRRLYADACIEDMWIPYFAVATDLTAQGPRVMRTGLLWRAVRASCALPGILPPMFTEDGHMLVDGAIADNVPLDIMKGLKTGPNLVVDLCLPRPQPFDVAYDSIPGRAELLTKLANPFGRRSLPACPGPASVVQRSIFTNVRQAPLPIGPLDLVLEPPPFEGSSFMHWEKHSNVAQASYRWGLETLEQLRADKNPAMIAMENALAS